MATKFYCRNEKCDKYNEEIHFNSVSYVIRDGHLTPKERLVCDHCNQEVEMVNVKNEGVRGLISHGSILSPMMIKRDG